MDTLVIPTAQNAPGATILTEPHPPYHPDPSKRLEELLERSRGIRLTTLDGATTRLSAFTRKQISRRVRLRKVKKPRRGDHPLTRRAKIRAKERRRYHKPGRRYWELRRYYGSAWGIDKGEWLEIWRRLGGVTSFLISRPDESAPFTPRNLIVRDRKGLVIYEGPSA
jgi:hypothetical protein